MKKIYFGCSIAGGRDHAHLYLDIVSYIKACKVQVLSETFADQALSAEVGHTDRLTPREIWQRDVEWIKQADALIMEVTQPSLGVGYEIGLAGSLDIPVLTLFYTPAGRRLSPMINGDPNVTVFEYNDLTETKAAIVTFIKQL